MNKAQKSIESANSHFFDDGYLTDNPPALQRLSLAAYRLLLGGKPVSFADLAAATNMDPALIRALFTLIPDCACDYSEDSGITAFIGLSIGPANHRFIVDGRSLYTWCVLDGLFLSELIGGPSVIDTRCPATRATIRVALSPDGISGASPDGTVMSLVDLDRGACRDDLRGNFCNHVNFFASQAAFRTWAADKPDYACVTLERAYAMARARNRARYPDIDWKAPDGRAT